MYQVILHIILLRNKSQKNRSILHMPRKHHRKKIQHQTRYPYAIGLKELRPLYVTIDSTQDNATISHLHMFKP